MYEINREGDRGRREENYMEKGITGPSNTKRGSGGWGGGWKIYFSLDHQQFTFLSFYILDALTAAWRSFFNLFLCDSYCIFTDLKAKTIL
jgi:hypothetical protein